MNPTEEETTFDQQQNAPELKDRAHQIASDFASENFRRLNDPKNKLPVLKGDHTPMMWRLHQEDDGSLSLCVVLNSGPKLFAPIDGKGLVRRAADAAVQAFKELTQMDERKSALDAREAELNQRQAELDKLAVLAEKPKK